MKGGRITCAELFQGSGRIYADLLLKCDQWKDSQVTLNTNECSRQRPSLIQETPPSQVKQTLEQRSRWPFPIAVWKVEALCLSSQYCVEMMSWRNKGKEEHEKAKKEALPTPPKSLPSSSICWPHFFEAGAALRHRGSGDQYNDLPGLEGLPVGDPTSAFSYWESAMFQAPGWGEERISALEEKLGKRETWVYLIITQWNMCWATVFAFHLRNGDNDSI